jgi:hypothetical protein
VAITSRETFDKYDEICKLFSKEIPGTNMSYYKDYGRDAHVFRVKDNITGEEAAVTIDGYAARDVEYLKHHFDRLKSSIIEKRGEWVGQEYNRNGGKMSNQPRYYANIDPMDPPYPFGYGPKETNLPKEKPKKQNYDKIPGYGSF